MESPNLLGRALSPPGPQCWSLGHSSLPHLVLDSACVAPHPALRKPGSVAGKGFYVCEYNQDYLKEKQLMMLEKRLSEVLEECKEAGLSKEEILEMLQTLLGM